MIEKQLEPGIYQHYKGPLYEVVGIGTHTETEEAYVVYKALYATRKYPINSLWIRPFSMFTETILVDGEQVPRFKKLRS